MFFVRHTKIRVFNEDGFGSDFHVTFKATAHTHVQYNTGNTHVQYSLRAHTQLGVLFGMKCSKAILLYTQAPKLTHTNIAYPAE